MTTSVIWDMQRNIDESINSDMGLGVRPWSMNHSIRCEFSYFKLPPKPDEQQLCHPGRTSRYCNPMVYFHMSYKSDMGLEDQAMIDGFGDIGYCYNSRIQGKDWYNIQRMHIEFECRRKIFSPGVQADFSMHRIF